MLLLLPCWAKLGNLNELSQPVSAPGAGIIFSIIWATFLRKLDFEKIFIVQQINHLQNDM